MRGYYYPLFLQRKIKPQEEKCLGPVVESEFELTRHSAAGIQALGCVSNEFMFCKPDAYPSFRNLSNEK